MSFLTVLNLHGLLSQIPGTIQIATTGHQRVLESPVGTYEFFPLKPGLVQDGISWSDVQLPYPLATGEKALLDNALVPSRIRSAMVKDPLVRITVRPICG